MKLKLGAEPTLGEIIKMLTQLGLDIGGIIEPTFFCDAASCGISILDGDWWAAGISVCSCVPYVGDLSKLGKIPKWLETLNKAFAFAKKNSRFRQTIRSAIENLKKVLDKAVACGIDKLKPLKRKIDEFLGGGSGVKGYRVMCKEEASDIAINGWRGLDDTMKDKCFMKNLDDAERWADEVAPDLGLPADCIGEVDIPKDIFGRAGELPNVDGIGDGVIIWQPDLPKLPAPTIRPLGGNN